VIAQVYRALWLLARALAPLLARGRGKLAATVRGRSGGERAIVEWAAGRRDPARKLVWAHAASVGEGRQAEAILVRLKAARPDWQLLYTYASESARRFAATLPADFAGFLPLDTATETGRALDAARPSALAFVATDVWPELVRQATRRGVRLALLSANLSERSSRLSALARLVLARAYSSLDVVGAVDGADARRLSRLGARAVVTGDTRHDAAYARAALVDRAAPHLAALTAPGPPVLVAGSTWPADERVLLPALERVLAWQPVRLVIAPHEPAEPELAALERALARLWPRPGALRRLSHLERDSAGGDGWSACLVDRVGVLAELYAAAALAYVGGGFHRAGLHAVVEPAALGVPVVFGPKWQSSRDAGLLLEADAARSAADPISLSAALAAWLTNDAARAAAGAAARAVVERGLGAAERSARLLIELVEAPRPAA
jgi:3-deoxy-D-manno-octulosonic-acid transferase